MYKTMYKAMQGCKALERIATFILFVFMIAYAQVTMAADVGEFINDVKVYKNTTEKYAIFYPDGHLNKAPIVLFASGAGRTTVNAVSNTYNGLLKYIASQGYYVIAAAYQGSYYPDLTIKAFQKALTGSRRYHPELDFSRLAVMGHSVGGGHVFPIMKHFLDLNQGYGSNANFVISIDGWFPFGMQEADLKGLNTTASIIQFGGDIGAGTDPKIHLTTMNLIPNANKKAYFVLGDATGHSYLAGDLASILNKQDLLDPIQALLDYKFKPPQNTDPLENYLFANYANTVSRVANTIENHNYWDSCLGGGYGAKAVLDKYHNDIKYCKPESYANKSNLTINSSRVKNRNKSSVIVYFSLSEKAQARIEYGKTTEYGHFTTKETSFKYDKHAQLIRHLDANTLYHYRVHAYDRNGVEVVSADKTFRINKQSTLKVKSSSVEIIDNKSVYIHFNLSQKAQARVEYGATVNYGQFTAKETSFKYDKHTQLIRHLDANTLYHYRVHAYDRNGVEVVSADKTFRINKQSTLKVKSSGVETIDNKSVYIHFNLNQKAQARIEYGTSANYGHFTAKETSFKYDAHSQKVSGLQANTLYHYRVHAYDRNGVEVVSNDKTFMVKSSAGYAFPPETDYHAIPSDLSVAKPDQRGATVVDPQFGTTITRVTDHRVLDVTGKSCTDYTYAKVQSWNADMSLLKVDFRLYDANTLEESSITKELTCDDGYKKLGSPGAAFRWSYVDPKVFYTLGSDNVFYKNTIDDEIKITSSVVKSFSKYGFEKMLLGSDEGNMSYDDRYVIFTAKKPGNDHIFAILLDTTTATAKVKELPNTTWGVVNINGSGWRGLYDWITVTPKGDHILENKTINGPQYVGQYLDNVETGIFMYDMNFENPQRIALTGQHGDIGINSQGQQVWVQFEFGAKNGTWSYNLDTLEDIGVGTKLTSVTSGHVSCQNYKRPGWCYLSPTRSGSQEVFAVKLDGSGKVNRFVQARRNVYKNDDSIYGGASPDGKRVVFQSNWEDNGPTDTFHAALKTANAGLNTKVLYDDAEDGNTNGWRVYDRSPAGATISNVFDGDKGSKVIKLQGSGTQNGYILGGHWNNTERKTIQWKMKYDEGYTVYISVNTKKGHRYIYYNASNEDYGLSGKYIHHGLGSFTKDGTWRVITRDLDADLKDSEPDNKLLSVKGFLIRGSGLVDDIQLLQ